MTHERITNNVIYVVSYIHPRINPTFVHIYILSDAAAHIKIYGQKNPK